MPRRQVPRHRPRPRGSIRITAEKIGRRQTQSRARGGGIVTGIAEQIREEVFSARLRRFAVLVVYDPHRRYRELCLSLAGDVVAVVDASESSIESRETAVRAVISLGRGEPGPKELLIYVPARAPVTDEERQV